MLNQRSLRSFKRCESFVQLSTRSLSYSSIEGSSGTVTNTGERRVTRDLIPEEIVKELNKHVIGQEEAKKAVAIALRNRWRRRQLKDDLLSKEISPMNILMSGPTGSGKTEIARRLAKISHSPFLKVEATKFTEIGIYGSNTDSMIKDLTDVAVEMERERAQQENAQAAKERALERLVDLLVIKDTETRAQIKQQIAKGELNERKVFVQLKPKRLQRRPHNHTGMENMMIEMPPELENMMQNLDKMLKSQLSESMGGLRAGLGDLTRRRSKGKAFKEKEMTIQEALPQLIAEEAENILDEEKIISKAIENVQNNGIIFLDEIDKLVGENGQTEREQGGYRKGEGVQKELLALTEGCAVNTRHGLVYTDHILFIASGAFHRCVPSDLMPELQGRLPIRVTLDPLGAKEFEKILLEKEYNLIHQTKALLETEGIQIDFTKEAIEEIALISQRVNHQMEDIGARRLATIVSKIIEEISFYAPKMKDLQHGFTIDKSYVQQRLLNVLEKTDLTKYIL